MVKLLTAILATLVIVLVPLSDNATAAPPDLGQVVRAHVTINAEGLFVIGQTTPNADVARLHGVFDPLNRELAEVDRSLRPTIQRPPGRAPTATTQVAGGGRLAALAASFCGYIPRWAFEAFAWYVIISGGAWAIVGAFVDATIWGLPAGAVMNAIGVSLVTTGFGLLWYVDTYMPPQGRYVCVF